MRGNKSQRERIHIPFFLLGKTMRPNLSQPKIDMLARSITQEARLAVRSCKQYCSCLVSCSDEHRCRIAQEPNWLPRIHIRQWTKGIITYSSVQSSYLGLGGVLRTQPNYQLSTQSSLDSQVQVRTYTR